LASLTKVFTALAMMQMAEERKLDIDEPLARYLPEFSIRSRFPDTGPVTLHHILSHHSGMPSGYMRGQFRMQPMTQAEILAGLKDQCLTAPPGEVYTRSDLAYGLLGCVIERVAECDIETYLRKTLLDPLGMRSTVFVVRDELRPAMARAFDFETGEPRMQYPTRVPASEGLWSSVDDLAQYVCMLFAEGGVDGKVLLKPETVASTLRPHNEGLPCDNGYRIGLDWNLSWPGLEYLGRVAWQDGFRNGYRSLIALSVDHKVGIIILTNCGGSKTTRRIGCNALKMTVALKTGIREPAGPQPKGPKSVPARYLDKLPGYYSSPVGYTQVERVGDSLRAHAFGYVADLLPLDEHGRFAFQYRLGGLIPIPLPFLKDYSIQFYEAADQLFMMFYDGPLPHIGQRTAPTPIPAPWLARLGLYEVTNRGDDLEYIETAELGQEGAFLTIAIKISLIDDRTPSALVVPISDNDAYVAGIGPSQGDRVYVTEVDGETRLHYAGYRFRPVVAPGDSQLIHSQCSL
ncbi:MAG TPA: class A beta-lactamase-related serine hydrolase, partial [Candidatus Hydrogenedentes bacterium]|nr:class A beta-lactamase-related serine hydrolase [Candidatus Hydrogenedentota bacterium]